MSTDAADRCTSCRAERPAHAPGGLCPRCLLRQGLGSDALSLSRTGELGATIALSGPPSLLDTLAATIGPVPRILLRDTDPGAEPPVVRPAEAATADPVVRYRIDGEIARGGMGAVLKGRDPDLGRDVALKVLRDDLSDRPEMVRRFVEEAQIGGQLQHPGIVPVYELGTFADRRPFFSMKLVKGQTLGALLASRPSPSDALPRFLGIFEQVAQTVAYAHARGVIHRDLKPSNVMVGSFGEVQVMDWGLAKVLPRGGVADDATAGRLLEQETVIATARSGFDGDAELSRAGSVMGTPSYMAPEQARGEITSIDERADVFALGSILAEILTGLPAFTGRTSGEIQARAAGGDLAGALGRLGRCGADPELTGLARDCLAPVRHDRPRDASHVAGRVAGYLASLERRLRAAEIERAAEAARVEEALRTAEFAQAQARAERRTRRFQVGLVATVLAASIAGGLGLTWWLQQRSARLALVGLALREAELLEAQAVDDPAISPSRWPEARAALTRAADLLAGADDPVAAARVVALSRRVDAGAGAAASDRLLLDRLATAQARLEDLPGNAGAAGRRREAQADAAYSTAFREAGLDPDSLDPAEFARRVRDRPARIAVVVAALDDWAAARLGRAEADAAARAGLDRIRAAARTLDPDPWRGELRESLAARDRGSLLRLAHDPRLAAQAPASLVRLASALQALDEGEASLAVLRHAQLAYPGDARTNLHLGAGLNAAGKHSEALQYLRAAVALQPGSAGTRTALAAGHYFLQDYESAIREALEAVRLEPEYPNAHSNLAMILQFAEGETLPPQEARSDQAIAHLREALRIVPEWGEARGFLADILGRRGRDREARAERARAVELLREAARRDPEDPRIPTELGEMLRAGGDLPAAAEAYREAARRNPERSKPRATLGEILGELGRHAEAVAALREAATLAPDDFQIRLALARALRGLGDYEGAIVSYRRANEIIVARSGLEADYVGRAIHAIEHLAALAPRLRAIARGEAQPEDNGERLELARAAHEMRLFSTEARLRGEAMDADPSLAADREAGHRYNAACAAALAAAGRGEDDPKPDGAARDDLRRRALGWLRAELVDWSRVVDAGDPKARASVAATLRQWQDDPDLAGVRDADALAALPGAEREAWRALWDEVDRIRQGAGQAP